MLSLQTSKQLRLICILRAATTRHRWPQRARTSVARAPFRAGAATCARSTASITSAIANRARATRVAARRCSRCVPHKSVRLLVVCVAFAANRIKMFSLSQQTAQTYVTHIACGSQSCNIDTGCVVCCAVVLFDAVCDALACLQANTALSSNTLLSVCAVDRVVTRCPDIPCTTYNRGWNG